MSMRDFVSQALAELEAELLGAGAVYPEFEADGLEDVERELDAEHWCEDAFVEGSLNEDDYVLYNQEFPADW